MSEPAERIRDLVATVCDGIGIEGCSVQVSESDEELRVTVDGEDLGLLIGKHGATIDALQHLALRAAFQGQPDQRRVVVDAAGYRDRRETALHRAADRAVTEALDFGRAVELEPMRPAERKIVHLYLRERTEVETHSEGDEPERRLVVTPLQRDA
jgi:spoIIIJ-associated protein